MGSKTVMCVETLNMAILEILKLQKTRPFPSNISVGGLISANGLVTEMAKSASFRDMSASEMRETWTKCARRSEQVR